MSNVWEAVKVLERLAEFDGEPLLHGFMHGPLEGEDGRIRGIVEDLDAAAMLMEALRHANTDD